MEPNPKPCALLELPPALYQSDGADGTCAGWDLDHLADSHVACDACVNAIFDLVTKATKPISKEPVEIWWNAKYWQIRAWIDEGEYPKADLALRDVDRNTNDFDGGKYGLRDLFKKMQSEVASKVINPNR